MKHGMKYNQKFPMLANNKKVLKKTTWLLSRLRLVVNALFALLASLFNELSPCTLLHSAFILDWLKED